MKTVQETAAQANEAAPAPSPAAPESPAKLLRFRAKGSYGPYRDPYQGVVFGGEYVEAELSSWVKSQLDAGLLEQE
jgi:hypothetical protein